MPAKKPTGPAGHLLSEFLPLLPAEEQLREACRTGGVARFGDERPTEKTAANHIRPEVLRVFCLGLDPDAPVHERGVPIRSAWIQSNGNNRSDDLDLAGCELLRPLSIWSTHFVGAIVARDATAKHLGFDGSRCAGISADRLTCSGGVFLRNGFRADGEVRFLGATIAGNLECTNATFATSKGHALSFDKAEIGGSVFLNGTFRADATVRFFDATIDGALICADATFAASEGDALSFDRAEIGGSVFLNGTFRANATVRFLGAAIGSNLECTNATFAASEGAALIFDNAKIAGGAFLNDTFSAERPILLPGASIGAALYCRGGHFDSLDLTRAEIGDTAYFVDGFRASGWIDLAAAEIEVFVDDENAWKGATLFLDGLTLKRFGGDAPVDAVSRIRWLERQPSDHLGIDFRPQPWEECARVLAAMGHERDARILRIEKRRRMRWLEWNRVKTAPTRNAVLRALRVWIIRRRAKRGGALTRRILAARVRTHAARVAAKFAKLPAVLADVVLDVATGYGRRPMKALGWLFALWIAAGVGYADLPPGVMAPTDALVYFSPRIPAECKSDWISLDPRHVSLTDACQIAAAEALGLPRHERDGLSIVPEWSEICARAMPSEYSTFSPFSYAADVLLPIVDLRQERDWSPRVTDAEGRVIAPLFGTADEKKHLIDWRPEGKVAAFVWDHGPGALWRGAIGLTDRAFPGWGYVARFLEWMLVLFGWGLSALLLGAVTGVIRRD